MGGCSPRLRRGAATEAIAVVVGARSSRRLRRADARLRRCSRSTRSAQTQTAWTARCSTRTASTCSTRSFPSSGSRSRRRSSSRSSRRSATVADGARASPRTRLCGSRSLVCFVLTALLLWGLVRHVAGPVSGVGARRRVRVHAVRARLEPDVDDRVPRDRRRGGVRVRRRALARQAAPGVRGARAGRRSRGDAREADDRRVLDPARARCTAARAAEAVGAAPDRPLDGGRVVAVPLARSGCSGRGTRTRSRPRARSRSGSTGWNLRRWNFGWTQQRLDPGVWQRRSASTPSRTSSSSTRSCSSPPRSRSGGRPQRRFWLAVAVGGAAGLLVFMNLYVHHDYYLAAVSPADRRARSASGCGWVWSRCGRAGSSRRCLWSQLLLAWGTLELGRLLDADPRRRRRPSGAAARDRDRRRTRSRAIRW